MKKIKTDAVNLSFGGVFFFKFMLFNCLWCLATTFVPFSTVEQYATSLLATLVLLAPYRFFRLWRTTLVLMLLVDGLLVANLMYFRTYYTAIPLSSYAIAGNLNDFKASVYDSLRWVDVCFPLSTLLAALLYNRYRRRPRVAQPKRLYWAAFGGAALLFAIVTGVKGGFCKAYEDTKQKAYLCSSVTPIYTVFGGLWYDVVKQRQTLSDADRAQIESWLALQPPYQPLDSTATPRRNCILILAESLESWVLERTVEGKEITPCLNRLIAEPTTLYAPQVLTQVKGGRSIDAQLLVCTGLLPINSGTYSSLYADNHYPSLQKALHAQYGTRNYLLTIDKVSTWNQGPIAQSFGTDTLIAYHDFELNEAFGTHKRTGDGSFFEQCCEKMERGEVWPQGERVWMQLVTYSGHAPFKMPDELKQIAFSDTLPQKMADYMTVANYTDRAIGRFVDYLKSRPEYAETLIVITGDHEGLATHRDALCREPAARGIVSERQHTPFIVVNSPVGLRYEKVMGQVDIYPTLLNLLRLDTYPWKGLGQSILSPDKPGVAVSPLLQAEGTADEATLDHLRKAYDVSDKMIRFDYLKNLEK